MKFHVTINIALKHLIRQLGLDGIPENMTRIDRSLPLAAIFFKVSIGIAKLFVLADIEIIKTLKYNSNVS